MDKIFDLKGRSALITGGSKGLGKAMAKGLASHGAAVMTTSRHQEELDASRVEILDAAGPDAVVETRVSDMTDREEVDALAAAAQEKFGTVDILINNAGGNVPEPIDEVSDENWDRIVELNLTGVMRLTRALVPGMKDKKWGRIIHISSVLGLGSKPGRNGYSATKAALIGLAKASALDLGPFGITVNCICPGPFLTDLPMSLLSEEEKAEFAAMTAVGRWGDPDEMMGPALLLASQAGSYITGTTLLVDGGAYARAL